MPTPHPPRSKSLEAIGKELKDNPPRQLAETAKKFGPKRAEKQRKAILLSKARRKDSGKRY